MNRNALLTRLGEGITSDRDLDCDIAIAFGLGFWAVHEDSELKRIPERLHFTDNVGACLSLIGPQYYWFIGKGRVAENDLLFQINIVDPRRPEAPLIMEAGHNRLENCILIAALGVDLADDAAVVTTVDA